MQTVGRKDTNTPWLEKCRRVREVLDQDLSKEKEVANKERQDTSQTRLIANVHPVEINLTVCLIGLRYCGEV